MSEPMARLPANLQAAWERIEELGKRLAAALQDDAAMDARRRRLAPVRLRSRGVEHRQMLRVLVPDLTKTEAVLRPLPPPDPTTLAATKAAAPKFTESQIVGRMKQIDQLFQENLLTDNFAAKRIAECTLTPETN